MLYFANKGIPTEEVIDKQGIGYLYSMQRLSDWSILQRVPCPCQCIHIPP